MALILCSIVAGEFLVAIFFVTKKLGGSVEPKAMYITSVATLALFVLGVTLISLAGL
jgi:hypothetical protein